jgi:hypothetical protein
LETSWGRSADGGVVSAQLESFFERQRRRERHVPRFIERKLREFLDCGILAHGFLRVHSDACGKDRLVAFSCKGRQWVLSSPFALRYRLAYDAALVSSVLQRE